MLSSFKARIAQEWDEAHHPGGMILGMICGIEVGMEVPYSMDAAVGRTVEETVSLQSGQYAQSLGSVDGLLAVVDPELAIDVAGVGLDRRQRDEQPPADLLVG